MIYTLLATMRTNTVTAIRVLPVLVDASTEEEEGIVLLDNFFAARPVRRMKASDTARGSFSRNFKNSQRQELVAETEELIAFVGLLRTYKQRTHASDGGQWKNAWNDAQQKYELSLGTLKKTQPTLWRNDQERRDFGRGLIEKTASFWGVDLHRESPEEAVDLWEGYRLSREAKSNPRLLLCQIASKHLSLANLVLWLSKDSSQIAPAIYCNNVRDAFYIKALLTLDEARGWTVCRYSRCNQIFEQSRSDQEYCSAAHRDAHRVAVWRTTPRGRRAMKRDSKRRNRKREAERQR